MRILLTNDDGFDAAGLAALWEAVHALGDVTVTAIAPRNPHSGLGHVFTDRLTIRTADVSPLGKVHVVEGTPVDCICAAVHHPRLSRPDWVIAGINAGGNLGVDIYPSGTVAAARQAAIFGIPAVAVSQVVVAGKPIDWTRAARETADVLAALLRPGDPPSAGTDAKLHLLTRRALAEAPALSPPASPCWNVNLPDRADGQRITEVRVAAISRDPVHLDYELTELKDGGERLTYVGSYHNRPAGPGTDVEAAFGGAITLSRLPI